MCKCLIDLIFNCCNCCRPVSPTQTKDMVKLGKKLEKRYAQPEGPKRYKPKKKSAYSGNSRYGTNWETLVHQVPMSPSQIGDSMITKDIEVDRNKYRNREDIYKFVLNNYEFSSDNQIGKGAFGEVYKIKEKGNNEWYAVKVMRLKGDNDMSRGRFDMFKNEVFCLRKNPHKNIIKLIDHKMASKFFISFLIMEYAEGGDVLHRLKQTYKATKRGFPEKETKTYFVQMANAMNFVHLNGLIHGDLKLENVLIVKTKDGKEVIKVSDFGCARVAYKEEEGIVNVDRAVGTIAYMAPEQLRVYIAINLKHPDILKRVTKTYNPIRADVWSLGICLYRMLFYDYPFIYDHERELESILKILEEMKKVIQFPPLIAKDLSQNPLDLIHEMVEYNKNKRIDMKTVMKHKWIHDSPYLDTNSNLIIK